MYGRNYNSYSSDNDCDCCDRDTDCCGSDCSIYEVCCGTFGYWLSFPILMVASILVIILLAVIYPYQTLALDPGETRLVTNYYPSLVKDVSFSQMDSAVDVYHLDKVPPLEAVATGKPYTDKETIVLGEEEYVNFSHWLNKGSTIDLSFSATRGAIHMYLLKSEMTFDSFKDAFYDGNHYVVWGSSTDLYRYSSNSKKNTIVYSVPEDDLYTIVFVNEAWRRGAEVAVDYTLQRIQYVLPSGAQPVCGPHAKNNGHEEWCKIKTKHHEKGKAILMVSPEVAPDNSTSTKSAVGSSDKSIQRDVEETYTVNQRVTYRWDAIFGWGCAILFGAIACCKCMRRLMNAGYSSSSSSCPCCDKCCEPTWRRGRAGSDSSSSMQLMSFGPGSSSAQGQGPDYETVEASAAPAVTSQPIQVAMVISEGSEGVRSTGRAGGKVPSAPPLEG